MAADRDTRNRLLALLGLWIFLSGLLAALSFVEVALVGYGVLLIAALAWGSVWLVRSSEVPWKVGALVLVGVRQGSRLAKWIQALAIPRRSRRLGTGMWRRIARLRRPVVRVAAGARASTARLPARASDARASSARIVTRARSSAADVPRRAPAFWARGLRTYAVAVYWTQLQIARVFHAVAARGPRSARRQALELNARGAQLRRRGEHEQAAEQHRAALAIARDLGDEQAEALTLNNLALALAQGGAEEEAVAHLEQARVVLHELGDEEHEAQVLANLAGVHRRQGHSEEAATLLHEALEKLPPESTAYRQVEEELLRAS